MSKQATQTLRQRLGERGYQEFVRERSARGGRASSGGLLKGNPDLARELAKRSHEARRRNRDKQS